MNRAEFDQYYTDFYLEASEIVKESFFYMDEKYPDLYISVNCLDRRTYIITINVGISFHNDRLRIRRSERIEVAKDIQSVFNRITNLTKNLIGNSNTNNVIIEKFTSCVKWSYKGMFRCYLDHLHKKITGGRDFLKIIGLNLKSYDDIESIEIDGRIIFKKPPWKHPIKS